MKQQLRDPADQLDQVSNENVRLAPFMPALTISADKYPIFDKLVLALFVLFVPFVIGSSPANFDDGDVSWHLATGQWILSNLDLPHADPFSFSAADRLWVAHEWVADILFAAAFNCAGYSGLAALVTLSLITLHLIIFLYLRRRVGPVVIFLSLLALDVVLFPFVLVRPHVMVWPLLAAWTALLLIARDEGKAPPLAAALLMLVWTNLHASFPLGLVIYGAVALDVIVHDQDWRLLRGWIAVGLASLVCALLNANGVTGLIYPFVTTTMGTLHLIEEWQPTTLANTPGFFVVLLLTLAGVLMSGVRFSLGRAVLLLSMLGLAFMQVRHQSWLAIVGAMLIPAAYARAQQPSPPFLPQSGTWRVWAAVAAAAASLVAIRVALPIAPRESTANPTRLIAAVPEDLRDEPVLNGYSFGGRLILAGIRPYIDGRSDMYGDAFFADHDAIVNGDGRRFDRAVAKYNIRWTMLPHGNKALIDLLDSRPGWRRYYADNIGVIHVRQ